VKAVAGTGVIKINCDIEESLVIFYPVDIHDDFELFW